MSVAWARTKKLPVVLMLAMVLALAACGTKNSAATAGGAASSTATIGGTSTTSNGMTSASAAGSCPTQNTRAFAKTRLVADLGLAAGTFHRYIYKPYKAGAFNKGAHGRTLALIKAAATAAADAKLLANATENIKANPTLCHTLYQPMTGLEARLSGLKNDVGSGNLTSIGSVEAMVSGLIAKATSNGLTVTETTTPAATP